jgi:hypothetical protein
VKEGDQIWGSISVSKSRSNFRELDIKMSCHVNTDRIKRDFVNMFKFR